MISSATNLTLGSHRHFFDIRGKSNLSVGKIKRSLRIRGGHQLPLAFPLLNES